MQFNLLSKLSRSSIVDLPYPHVIIENALPSDIYEQLSLSFPTDYLLSKSPYVLNDRGHTKRFLYKDFHHYSGLASIWNEFAAANTSSDFFNTVINFFFEPSISKYYPSLLGQIKSLNIANRTLNDKLDSGKCLTDFQLVANLPVNDSHSSRSPHLDNPQQLYALLFYMKEKHDPSIGGGLQLFSPRRSALSATHQRGRALSAEHLSLSKLLNYSENTAILFLNTRCSYHAVQPIYEQQFVRRSINIIGELPPGSQLFTI